MTEERRRQRLHDLVVERVAKGLTRSDAMHAVAVDEQQRAGYVAASFYRVERELAREATAARRPEQLTLDGAG